MTRSRQVNLTKWLCLAAFTIAAILWSHHALNSHKGQYTSVTIWERYERKICKPMKCFACQDGKILLICGIDMNKDLYGGLWIGKEAGQLKVIGGHAARWAYWQRKIKGQCNIPLATLP